MAFSVQIDVSRRLPIINGFVSIPDGQAFLRTKLTPEDVLDLIPGTSIVRLGKDEQSFSMPTVQKASPIHRQNYQLWLILPDFDRLEGPADDWFQILRDAAETA